MTEQRRHQPVLTEHLRGWAVYCDACSDEAQDYVQQCLGSGAKNWPPLFLVPETLVERADRETPEQMAAARRAGAGQRELAFRELIAQDIAKEAAEFPPITTEHPSADAERVAAFGDGLRLAAAIAREGIQR